MSVSSDVIVAGYCKEDLGLMMQAISAWRDNTGFGRVQLVKQYFLAVEGKPLSSWGLVFTDDWYWNGSNTQGTHKALVFLVVLLLLILVILCMHAFAKQLFWP